MIPNVKNTMTHASLFSGIGGAELAALWVGWKNVFHCEINPFGRRVIEYHFPESKSYEDVTTTDFSEYRGRIDVLTAGFPCQPFSVAGQRKGAEDNRYLWPEVVRVICEVQPAWVVGENVAGILTMVQPGEEVEVGSDYTLFGENDRKRVLLRQEYVIETICRDLEREGYEVQPFVIPACAVGAPHRRDRVWFVAHRADRRDIVPPGGERATIHAGQGVDGGGKYGATSDTDINRQRWRKNQQVTVAGCKGASYDCACSEDGPSSYTDGNRHSSRESSKENERRREDISSTTRKGGSGSKRSNGLFGFSQYATNSNNNRLQGNIFSRNNEKDRWEVKDRYVKKSSYDSGLSIPADRWKDFPTQSPVCSGDDELSTRLDGITFSRWRQESIKSYGNAWVPQVAYEIFKAIQQAEEEIEEL